MASTWYPCCTFPSANRENLRIKAIVENRFQVVWCHLCQKLKNENFAKSAKILRVTTFIRKKEVDHESRPWSNISPRGELDPVRRACFPSIPSKVCAIKWANALIGDRKSHFNDVIIRIIWSYLWLYNNYNVIISKKYTISRKYDVIMTPFWVEMTSLDPKSRRKNSDLDL